MATTRVIFNTDTKIKAGAQKRARAEGTDLTSILNQAMFLYTEGIFHPDDFLTKEDMLAIRRGLADAKAGRVYSVEEVNAHFDRIDSIA